MTPNSHHQPNAATTTTILLLTSSDVRRDATFLRQQLLLRLLLVASSFVVTPEQVVLEPPEDDDNEDEVNRDATTTSIYIVPLTTLLLFRTATTTASVLLPPPPLPHPNQNHHHGSTTTTSPCISQTVWMVPPEWITTWQRHSFEAETTVNDHNVVTTIPLPSGTCRLILVSNTVDISTSTVRRQWRRQQLPQIPFGEMDNHENDTDLHPTPHPKHHGDDDDDHTMMEIPLETLSDPPLPDRVLVDDPVVSTTTPTPPPFVVTSLDSKILTTTTTMNDTTASSSTSSSEPDHYDNGTMSYQPLTLNATTPQAFETDLFRGQILVVVRPNPATADDFWYQRLFRHKKRRLVINVQGQFKSVPRGILYAGAEVSPPMKLGLVMKGICTILLKLVERFNANVHSSFGTTARADNNNNEHSEVAHIVAPAYTFYERLVVTPPDQTPPSLLDEIIESPASIQTRKSCTSWHALQESSQSFWNTTDTYTFSFYSMYIDLPSWQLVGLPASGDLSLQTFWGTSSLLRICMYDQTTATATQKAAHVRSQNRYAFAVQLEYLGPNGDRDQQPSSSSSPQNMKMKKRPPIASTTPGDDDGILEHSDRGGGGRKDDDDDIVATDRRLRHQFLQPQKWDQPVLRHSESQLFLLPESSSYDESMEEEHDDDDDLPFFDAKESHASLSDECTDSYTATTTMTIDSKWIQQLLVVDQYCPYWVELGIPSRNGSSLQYVTVFLCRMTCNSRMWTTFRLESECHNLWNDDDVDDYHYGSSTSSNSNSMPTLDAINAAVNRFSSRISSLEKLRRCIGLLLSEEYGNAVSRSNKMIAFRREDEVQSLYDLQFLSSSKIKPPVSNMVRWSGFIARAYSDRHWVEELVCVHERYITFRHLDRRKSSEFVLLLTNIIRVEPLAANLCPFHNPNPILTVSTLASTIYLMFASDSDLKSWCRMIEPTLSQQKSDGVNNKIVDTIGTAAEDLLHKSSLWNCKNRRILNCGSFFFRTVVPTIESYNPLTMAEQALRQATEIATSGLDQCTENQLQEFMKCAAMLKQAHVSGLDEASRLAFFLNVYHTMISHAYLVLGPPDSSLKWINYFNNIAYQVGDDIFSLTELEHSIIRASMSYPTQFLSRFIIPKSAYPSLALTISDCRVNFALNCGSLSNPSKIILYQPQHLSQQLDEASRLYLLNGVTYRRTGSGDLELKLPRICQWFADDFGRNRSDLLSAIEPYLSLDVQRQLNGCRLATPAGGKPPSGMNRFDMSSIIIRYHSYNFECRPLSIL